jgi:hypothetical protein
MIYPSSEDFNKFWMQQAEWSNQTFGTERKRGPVGPLKHLEKEAREAYGESDKTKQQEEIIDCFFLVVDAARRAGLTPETFFYCAFWKLEKNKNREWQKPTTPNEAVEHIRDGEPI